VPEVVGYVISVDEAHREQLAAVVQHLREAGLHDPDVQPHLGIISGFARDQDAAALRSVPGVEHVERSRALDGRSGEAPR
jgi:hypothetical protein